MPQLLKLVRSCHSDDRDHETTIRRECRHQSTDEPRTRTDTGISANHGHTTPRRGTSPSAADAHAQEVCSHACRLSLHAGPRTPTAHSTRRPPRSRAAGDPARGMAPELEHPSNEALSSPSPSVRAHVTSRTPVAAGHTKPPDAPSTTSAAIRSEPRCVAYSRRLGRSRNRVLSHLRGVRATDSTASTRLQHVACQAARLSVGPRTSAA